MEKTENAKSCTLERKDLKSWKEINKARKEERRKWREKKLKKKIKEEVNLKSEDVEERKPIKQKISTISIAVPGSILDNAQSDEFRTYLAGQIARAAVIFQIDEIIVYDDLPKGEIRKDVLETGNEIKTSRRCCVQLARILQYLECPQYLRKYFFPIHKDLRFVGVLNPIDTPHHLRQDDHFTFREGVVTTKPPKTNRGSQVYVGLFKDVEVDKLLTPGLRCTVKIHNPDDPTRKLKGLVVSPHTPRQETGVYWGYTVRLAESVSHIFSESPYKDGYDLLLGTSDKGKSIDECSSFVYDHLLVMFGGLAGLEAAFESDELLKVNDPTLLFDHYLNTLPNQGSRTIRTEEAILVSLAALRPKLDPKFRAPTFKDNFTEQKYSFD
ncbi:putative methyltransferase C9orf114 homolog [Agrilus planipennis]|uniref:Methyltransferase C9orf114 homolog n=1 Tax=Agrilus planipennis TaxID=224129 RepID=A0A1W4XHX2_AGRPL|nr:putative methyltransferase C9orf114 homolog [Agrilus planipennis]